MVAMNIYYYHSVIVTIMVVVINCWSTHSIITKDRTLNINVWPYSFPEQRR
jgi:hypothetical protein